MDVFPKRCILPIMAYTSIGKVSTTVYSICRVHIDHCSIILLQLNLDNLAPYVCINSTVVVDTTLLKCCSGLVFTEGLSQGLGLNLILWYWTLKPKPRLCRPFVNKGPQTHCPSHIIFCHSKVNITILLLRCRYPKTHVLP